MDLFSLTETMMQQEDHVSISELMSSYYLIHSLWQRSDITLPLKFINQSESQP